MKTTNFIKICFLPCGNHKFARMTMAIFSVMFIQVVLLAGIGIVDAVAVGSNKAWRSVEHNNANAKNAESIWNISYENRKISKKYKKKSIIKKHIVDMDNAKWNFIDNKALSEERLKKWGKGARPEQLVAGAVPPQKSRAVKNRIRTNGIDSSSEYEPEQHSSQINPKSDDIMLAENIRLVGKSETRGLAFNNAKTVSVDQRVYYNRTEVYGAYAEVYGDDDFSLAVGPEYSHVSAASKGQDDALPNSELGFGLQLKIGF